MRSSMKEEKIVSGRGRKIRSGSDKGRLRESIGPKFVSTEARERERERYPGAKNMEDSMERRSLSFEDDSKLEYYIIVRISDLVTSDGERKCARMWFQFCEEEKNPEALEQLCKALIERREADLNMLHESLSDGDTQHPMVLYVTKNSSEVDDMFARESTIFQDRSSLSNIVRNSRFAHTAKDDDEEEEVEEECKEKEDEDEAAKIQNVVNQMSQSVLDKLLLRRRTEQMNIPSKDMKGVSDPRRKKDTICEMIETIKNVEVVYVLLNSARKYAARRANLLKRRGNRKSAYKKVESEAIGSLLRSALTDRKKIDIRKCPSLSDMSSTKTDSSLRGRENFMSSKREQTQFWDLLNDLQKRSILNRADLAELGDKEFNNRMLRCPHMSVPVFRQLRASRECLRPIESIVSGCNEKLCQKISTALRRKDIENVSDLLSLSDNAFEILMTSIPNLPIMIIDAWKRRRRERRIVEIKVAELEMKTLNARRQVRHFESAPSSKLYDETDRALTQRDFFTLHGEAFRKSYLVSNFSSSRFDQMQRSYDRTQTVDRIMSKAQLLMGSDERDRVRRKSNVEELVRNLKSRGIHTADHFYAIQDETFDRVFGELCQDIMLFEMLREMREDRTKKRKLLQSRFVEQRKSVFTSLRILSITDVDTRAMSFRASILVFLVWNDPTALEALKKHRIGLGDDEAKLLTGHQLSHEEWTEHVKFHPQVGFANMKETEEVFDDDWNQKSDPPKIKLVPKVIYRHVLPKKEYDRYADLIFLQVQTVNACFNESYELDRFPFDTQRLHFILRPREDYRKIILRQFRGPFDDGRKGPNNDASNYQDGRGCSDGGSAVCCMCAPGDKEEVVVAMTNSAKQSGLEYVSGIVDRSKKVEDGRIAVKLINRRRQSLFPSCDEHDTAIVPIGQIYRAKLCKCSRRGIKRSFRNHISKWAAKAVPEFDFHYATVKTYMDATSLTNTYSIFEFSIHIERKAGYYFYSYYVTLISCIVFTLMLFSTEPLVTDRFENLVALVLTCTALKFTLAEHVPAEAGVTMLDNMMFFCIALITVCGLECWALDTFAGQWGFDDEVDDVNMWFAFGTTFVVLLFGLQHMSKYMEIRGTNYLEMLRADVEWLASGGDDSFGRYETPEKIGDISRNRLVASPKADKIAEYARLFRRKDWQLDVSTMYGWLDSLRNNQLAGHELFDLVGVYKIVVEKMLTDPKRLKQFVKNEGSFFANSDNHLKDVFKAVIIAETLKRFFKMCGSLSTKSDKATFTATLMHFFDQERLLFLASKERKRNDMMENLRNIQKEVFGKFLMDDETIIKIEREVRKEFRNIFVEHFSLVYNFGRKNLSQDAIRKIHRLNEAISDTMTLHEKYSLRPSLKSPLKNDILPSRNEFATKTYERASKEEVEMTSMVGGRLKKRIRSSSADNVRPPPPPALVTKSMTVSASERRGLKRSLSNIPGGSKSPRSIRSGSVEIFSRFVAKIMHTDIKSRGAEQFHIGDYVRIIKPGSHKGKTAQVKNPHLESLVQVEMDGSGDLKTYRHSEIEKNRTVKLLEMQCRVFFLLLRRSKYLAQFVPDELECPGETNWFITRNQFERSMITRESLFRPLLRLKDVSDLLSRRHGREFTSRQDLDVRGHPSQSVVERARNFYLARPLNDDIRSIVISDTKLRMKALMTANTLGKEAYLQGIGLGISWRWFGLFSLVTAIFRRIFYIKFFFEQIRETRLGSAYYTILSCCCCCCRFRLCCCCGRRRRR